MRNKSIVYVNFTPYDNAGRILDYLTENFTTVIHFSYDHLRLKKSRPSKLTIYQNSTVVLEKKLIWLRTHPILLFPSLPIVALLISVQTCWYVLLWKKKIGFLDYYLSVNAFTACTGILLKKIGIINQTIFWVWDYFPPYHPDWRLRIARWVYAKFDQPAIRFSDKTIFLNRKLKEVRNEKNNVHPIVPIGTNPIKEIKKKKGTIIGHMGMLKVGQGLDLLFNTLPALRKQIPDLTVEIIGSGPDENYFRKRAKKFSGFVKFYGFIEKDDDVDAIMRQWSIGIAPYMPIPSSEHYWTDPSKIKAYINQAVPVITTDVPEFALEVKKYKSGIVVNYYNPEEFVQAVLTILKAKQKFAKNALLLAQKYAYKKLYVKLFS